MIAKAALWHSPSSDALVRSSLASGKAAVAAGPRRAYCLTRRDHHCGPVILQGYAQMLYCSGACGDQP